MILSLDIMNVYSNATFAYILQENQFIKSGVRVE
jgi:hypothetical protein